MMLMKDFGETTILFLNDEAFNLKLIDHILSMIKISKNIRLLLSTKAKHGPTYIKRLKDMANLKFICIVSGYKIISNETSPFHFSK